MIQEKQSGTRGADQKKSFSDYTKRHQERIRRQLATDCETSLSFLDTYDFVATEVKVFNFATDQFETFRLVESDRESSGVSSESCNKDIDQINLLLYTKDRFGLSNQAYHELLMAWRAKNFPGHTKLRKEYKKLTRSGTCSKNLATQWVSSTV